MEKIDFNYSGGTIRAGDGCFLRIKSASAADLAAPLFSLKECSSFPSFVFAGQEGERSLKNGGIERRLAYNSVEGLCLTLELQSFPGSSAVRFRYRLDAGNGIFHLGKPFGKDEIVYTGFSVNSGVRISEYQFSQFVPHIHSYIPLLKTFNENELLFNSAVPGPALIVEQDGGLLYIGYEHGAAYPDSYLEYRFADSGSRVSLCAKKGNYYDGQQIGGGKAFVSPWFHLVFAGDMNTLAAECRRFYERFITQNAESRKPYIFYNTWNYQERDRNFRGLPYLHGMKEDRLLEEIEQAHEIGIDMFVIDTGWFKKSGDWLVNIERFPGGMKLLKEKLDSYGMKLGLWFNPTVAARTSEIVTGHPEYRMSWDGESHAHPIWETEESFDMCLASPYWEWFADKLIELNRELGVVYFKWDGIGQWGCNSPLHDHGKETSSAAERAECYGYLMGLRMIAVAEKLYENCPGAIVDFDITEGGRFVGLGFLSAGKYFLVNNGPYARDIGLPEEYRYAQKEPFKIEPLTNIFFYPGAARPRFCRTGVLYDNFIPSSLFLTHYLPDGDKSARENSLAGLVLGGNGIWGSLKDLTVEETAFWKENLSLYKEIRGSVCAAAAKITGCIGSSPEIYIKADIESGKGLIVFFTCQQGIYSAVVGPFKKMPKVKRADSVEDLGKGYLRISVKLEQDSARTVFLLD